MGRGLTAEQRASTRARHRVVAPLVAVEFASGTLRLTTMPYNITTMGATFFGGGMALAIAAQTESVGSIEGFEITLSGLDAAAAELALREPFRGRLAKLWKAFLDPDTFAVIGDPVLQSIGRVRAMPITEDNTTATITLQVEHYDAELQRPAPLRYNNADQQRLYPGDRGAEFVEETAEKKVVWPSKAAQMRTR